MNSNETSRKLVDDLLREAMKAAECVENFIPTDGRNVDVFRVTITKAAPVAIVLCMVILLK